MNTKNILTAALTRVAAGKASSSEPTVEQVNAAEKRITQTLAKALASKAFEVTSEDIRIYFFGSHTEPGDPLRQGVVDAIMLANKYDYSSETSLKKTLIKLGAKPDDVAIMLKSLPD